VQRDRAGHAVPAEFKTCSSLPVTAIEPLCGAPTEGRSTGLA
jgi:hypothetical protein